MQTKHSTYLGYSLDKSLQYKATSGGVGSSLLRFLFEYNIIQSAISFNYNRQLLKYEPIIIYTYEDYDPQGSIYHEINLIRFIQSNIDKIRGTFACFSIPCQTKAIRRLLDSNNHNSIIIGLACSSQQTIEATQYLLKRLNVDSKEVFKIKYRGEGWPSGIKIKMLDEREFFIENNSSLWTDIFHSRLFVKRKCFFCQDTLNTNSDITLADPWLSYIINTERIGKSLVFINTVLGAEILKKAVKEQYLLLEFISVDEAIKSQIGTIERKKSYFHSRNLTEIMYTIFNNKFYRKLALNKYLFHLHIKFKNRLENFMIRNLKDNE